MICFLFFLARGIVHSKQIEQQLTKLSKLRLALSSWWKSSREKTQGHLFGKFKELLGNLGLSTRMSVLGGRPPWQHFGSILGEAAPKKEPKLRQAGLQPSTPPADIQTQSRHSLVKPRFGFWFWQMFRASSSARAHMRERWGTQAQGRSRSHA